MPGAIAPIAGAVIGGLFQSGQNSANNNAQQNAQNNAQQFSLQQQQQAEQFLQQQRAAALQAYQQYIQQNPNPVQGWGNISGPLMQGPQSVGGGVLGSNGMPQQGSMPQQAQPQINPAQLMQLLQLMYSPTPGASPGNPRPTPITPGGGPPEPRRLPQPINPRDPRGGYRE